MLNLFIGGLRGLTIGGVRIQPRKSPIDHVHSRHIKIQLGSEA